MTASAPRQTELLVIGAGPGGYVAAIRGAQLGAEVTLVERDAVGGTCLNYGCIPSKALISATNVAEDAAAAGEMGVDADVSVDIERMVAWKRDIVDRLTGGVEQLCRSEGVDIVEGVAAFVDEDTVEVQRVDADEPDHIAFEDAIVATGSQPIELPAFPFSAPEILSSREALSMDHVPDRLVVIGAGYIGMELSTVFAKLGSEVTVVEMLDDVLPTYEADIAAIVRERAESLGIEFQFGEAASSWTDTETGIEVTTETEAGETSTYGTDRVLVAIGRDPVTDPLALDRAGLSTTDGGFLQTDRRGQTAVDSIYAVGDVAGDPMLAHAASHEGLVAAHDAVGDPIQRDSWIVPAVVFTDPEVATVGLSADEAEDAGFEPLVGTMPFSASGRAMTTGDTTGFVRVVATGAGGLLGAQIVGPEASELIGELAIAVTTDATLHDLARTIHVHPTLSEAVMEAAEQALGQAIHTTN